MLTDKEIIQRVWEDEYWRNYPYLKAEYEAEFKELFSRSLTGRVCILSAHLREFIAFLAGKIKGA